MKNNFKIVCEAWDNVSEAVEKQEKGNLENKVLGGLGIAGGAAALAGTGISHYNTNKYLKRYNDDTTPSNIIHGGMYASTALGTVAGIGALVMRDKRQRLVFNKVTEKYPTAADLYTFVKSQGLRMNGLDPNMTDEEYAKWVQINIVKKGSIWRFLGALVAGFGVGGAIYQGAKLYNRNRETANEIVNKELPHNKSYDLRKI